MVCSHNPTPRRVSGSVSVSVSVSGSVNAPLHRGSTVPFSSVCATGPLSDT